jgi:putative membrane protein
MRRRDLLAFSLIAAAATGPAAAQSLIERFAGTGAGASTFVQMVTISDNFEIESARILLARSQHPQIRAFAEKMIADHTAMSAELRAMPEASTRQPATLDERHSRLLDTLRQQEEVDWLNRYYVDQQIDAHEEAVAAFDTYAQYGEVPALKAFAAKHAPMIRQHLETIRALQLPAQTR